MELPSGEDQVKSGIVIKRLDAEGAGLARIAMLSAVDEDGDTYAPGAFAGPEGGGQTVKVLAAHDWSVVPIGKARVFEDGDEALAEFQLNLDSQTAREWHAALKFDLDPERSGGPPRQEWSYGFRIVESESETRDGERVRVLKRLKVHEISPVVRGAGLGTATLALKMAALKTGALGAGRPFREQIAAVTAAVGEVAARAAQVAALRAEDGREISAERRKQLDQLEAELEAACGELAAAKAAIGALAQCDAGAAGRAVARTARTLSRRHLPRRS